MTCRVCGVPQGEGQCGDCRDLADEIRINCAVLAALRDEILPLGPPRTSRRRPRFPWGAAAAAILIALAVPLTQHRPPEAPVPAQAQPRRAAEPLKVKILTPNPDVVIYWLIDSKEKVR
jgi:hypothetical protein